MRSDFPKRVHVELTNKCNLSCPFCPRKYVNEEEGFMPEKLWKKIINECSKYCETTIMPFWRGEALLHPRFCEFISYALENELNIELATNGILINEENVDLLMKMKAVSISIHNEKSFEKAVWFASQKTKKYPLIQISFVSNEPTIQTIMNEVIKNPQSYGMFNRVRLYEEHSLNGVFGANLINVKKPRIFCRKLDDLIVVSFKGTISRCSYLWNCEDDLNLKNMALSDIWNSKQYLNIYRDYPDTKCKNCDQWNGETNGKIFNVVDLIKNRGDGRL